MADNLTLQMSFGAAAVPVALSSSLLDSAPIAMALTDLEGVVLWSNTALERLLGADTVLVGSVLYDVIRDHDVADEQHAIAEMLGGRSTWYVREQQWRSSDGDERLVRVMATLAVDECGEPTLFGERGQPCVIRQVIDETEGRRAAADRRVLLEELRRRNADLERSNQELEQFASVASHDLSEPLRVIAGHVDLLARRYQGQLDETADRYIAFAVDGCARMRRLINDLLRYSRTGRELLTSEVDLAALAQRVVSDTATAIEECEGTVVLTQLPIVVGDATQLGQVFSNLIANALKFRRSDRAPVVHVGATERAHAWAITVSDNGIGIPARHRERVFGLFERLHTQELAGTGIGLAICRKVVERHGGEITVADSHTGGTAFTFTLPKAVGGPEAP